MTAAQCLCMLNLFCALTLTATAAPRWWKGNLHTHSLWSDGDDFPEMIVDWYKTNGYHFLSLSDHNIFQDESIWMYATEKPVDEALPRYLKRFGATWVEQSEFGGAPI